MSTNQRAINNIPGTSTKVDVANWRQQVQSKFQFQSILQIANEDWHAANGGETLFIGVLKEEKEKEKEKEKDNQYKLKKAMATPLA